MRRLINRRPGRNTQWILGVLPFAALFLWYTVASGVRLAENPNDKLLPSMASIGASLQRYALTADERTGKYLFWADTAASLRRLGLGLACAAMGGLIFGIAIGTIPMVRVMLAPLVAASSMIPPLAILPILFILFGLDEISKVVLIVIGVMPFLIRDLALYAAQLPNEQMIKIQTLGASTWQIVIRMILPQLMPRLIEAVRLSIGPAFLFLIAAEAISANEGLGYRIFVLRRYMAMDVILPYVAWITLLAFALDATLRQCSLRAFPWHNPDNR